VLLFYTKIEIRRSFNMAETVVNSTPTGVEGLCYAVLTDEILNTYSEVVNIAPLVNIKVTPKVSGDSLYADNLPIERLVVLGEIDVEIETSDLALEVQAGLLGSTFDAIKGVLTHSFNDIAPYVALGFKIRKANGKYRYVWLLKGMFQEVIVEGATQADKAVFTTPKISAVFLARKDGNWKYTADDDSGSTPVNTTFLAAVYPGV